MNVNDKAVRLGQIYAQAFFELAEQSQLVDVLKEDLNALEDLITQMKDFEILMASPYFHVEYKKQLVNEVLSGRLNQLTTNFLMVVIEHNRIKFLTQIIEKYNELWEDYHGCRRVKVTVCKAMDNAEIERLTGHIAGAINSKVKLELVVNPSIIGGIIIHYGDKVMDNSVRNRLQLAVKEITKQGETHEV